MSHFSSQNSARGKLKVETASTSSHDKNVSHEPTTSQLRPSPTDSSKTDPEETSIADLWKPSEHRPDRNAFTAWTPELWHVDPCSRYGTMTFRDFILPCIAAVSPLKSRRESIPWADEFVKKDHRVYRGFPKTERHCSETDTQFIVGVLADLVNAFLFHIYRKSFRRKVAEGETQQVKDLREDLCRALKLDRKVLSHRIWTSYDLLKPGGKHFETAMALWRSVSDHLRLGEREAYRVELLGKRIAIFGEYIFGIPGVQTLRDDPVRAVQVLQAHVKKINPTSYTFLDVLEERDRKIRGLELQMERYKYIAADLYFRHILEQLPGPIPLDSTRKRTTTATKHWDEFLRNAMRSADDVNHPLHQLLSLVNDKDQAVRLLGASLYQSLSINIHHEFIALDSNASTNGYSQTIPDFKYSKLERALFKAILPLQGQNGTELDWDREKNRYITRQGAPGQGLSWREGNQNRFGHFQGGIHPPRGPGGWPAN